MATPHYSFHGVKRGQTVSDDNDDDQRRKKKRFELADNRCDRTGDWDDSVVYTQQELDAIDNVVASQVCQHVPSVSAVSKIKSFFTGQHMHVDEHESQFVLPTISYQSETHEYPKFCPVTTKKNLSSSSLSSGSSVYPKSSASLTSIFSRKTPSSEVSSAAGSLTSPSSGSHSTYTNGMMQYSSIFQSNSSTPEFIIASLQHKLHEKELNAKKCLEEVFAKTGEIKTLRESIQRQELELEGLRAERSDWKDTECQHQEQRCKELGRELERLSSVMQFKDQDIEHLQLRCRTLDGRLSQLQDPPTSILGHSSDAILPSQVTFGRQNKQPRLLKAGFSNQKLTDHGFPLDTNLFSIQNPSMSSLIGTPATEDAGTMTTDDGEKLRNEQRVAAERHKLLSFRVFHGAGHPTGRRLLAQLIDCCCSVRDELDNGGGILGLLPARTCMSAFKHSHRCKITPTHSGDRRNVSSIERHLQQKVSAGISSSTVSCDNFVLAAHGLKQMASDASVTETRWSSGGFEHAVLILPMLNDYLSHYVDMHSNGTVSTSTTPNNARLLLASASGSSEATTGADSFCSSVRSILSQADNCTTDAGLSVVTALCVLNRLVCGCAHVRQVLVCTRQVPFSIQPGPGASSSSVDSEMDKERPNESGMDGDDEYSASSSKNSSVMRISLNQLTSPSDRIVSPNLLMHVVRLASPVFENMEQQISVLEAALDVLISLASNLPPQDMDRLLVVVLRGVLSDCFQAVHQLSVTVRALELFCCLARSQCLLHFLCTKSDSCNLLNLYLASLRFLDDYRTGEIPWKDFIVVTLNVMDCICSLVLFHKNGVHILLDNDCRCSSQLLPCLVHVLLSFLRHYWVGNCDDSLAILRKGVFILHNISTRNHKFQEHVNPVRVHYILLISGLVAIYKQREGSIPKSEVTALEDMDETEVSSQDSDHDNETVVNE